MTEETLELGDEIEVRQLYLVEVNNVYTERQDIRVARLTKDEAAEFYAHFGGDDCADDGETCAHVTKVRPIVFEELKKELY